MKIRINPKTGQPEGIIDAILSSINTENVQENSKGTKYYLANCTVTYPDCEKAKVTAGVWAKMYDKGLVKIDEPVEISVQLKGEYEGYAKVELSAGQRVDVAKLGFSEEAIAKALEAFEGAKKEAVNADI